MGETQHQKNGPRGTDGNLLRRPEGGYTPEMCNKNPFTPSSYIDIYKREKRLPAAAMSLCSCCYSNCCCGCSNCCCCCCWCCTSSPTERKKDDTENTAEPQLLLLNLLPLGVYIHLAVPTYLWACCCCCCCCWGAAAATGGWRRSPEPCCFCSSCWWSFLKRNS